MCIPQTAPAYLRRADSRVKEVENRLRQFDRYVGRLHRRSVDTGQAVARLARLRADLDDWRQHRAEVRQVLGMLDGNGMAPN